MGRGLWQSSPIPLGSTSTCVGLGTFGQLSWKSGIPSLSVSGGGGGGAGGGGGGGSLYAKRLRLLLYVPLCASSHSMCTSPTPGAPAERAPPVVRGAGRAALVSGSGWRCVAAKV